MPKETMSNNISCLITFLWSVATQNVANEILICRPHFGI